MLYGIIAFVIVIAVCVLVHEFGHYITAKILGVQVHEFAFGMGPAILQHRSKNNMLWSWRLLPVGGFCRLAGMNEDEEDEIIIPGMGFNEQCLEEIFYSSERLTLQFNSRRRFDGNVPLWSWSS